MSWEGLEHRSFNPESSVLNTRETPIGNGDVFEKEVCCQNRELFFLVFFTSKASNKVKKNAKKDTEIMSPNSFLSYLKIFGFQKTNK